MLVLFLLQEKQSDAQREVTRARLSELALKRLWFRTRIDDELLIEIQEELLRVGWVLFWAGSTYAVIKVEAVEGWGQISSKRIADKLDLIDHGRFDFQSLEHLLLPRERNASGGQADDL